MLDIGCLMYAHTAVGMELGGVVSRMELKAVVVTNFGEIWFF